MGVRAAACAGGKRHIDSVRTKDGVEFTACTVVNAAGAFAADVVGMALGEEAGASFEVALSRASRTTDLTADIHVYPFGDVINRHCLPHVQDA